MKTFNEFLIESKKLTKKNQAIVEFIKGQINIDLTSNVDVDRSTRKYFTVYTDELSSEQLRQVESLGFSSEKYRIEPNGRSAIAVFPL